MTRSVRNGFIRLLLFGSLAAGGCWGVGEPPRDRWPFDGGNDLPPPPFDGGLPFDIGPLHPQPSFGPTVEQAVPPPALTGGTLAVLSDGTTAVAADPDNDRVYLVNLGQRQLRSDVTLQAGDQPGRIAEDAGGRVHVVLRGAQTLATIEVASGTVLGRRLVCAEPRGVGYEASGDVVHVACAGGELVTLPANPSGAAVRTLQLGRDLRDVVVSQGQVLVSRFRRAELLAVSSTGVVTVTARPPLFSDPMVRMGLPFEPATAWRTIGAPGGGVFMVHQRAATQGVVPTPGGYGGQQDRCASSIIHAAVSSFDGSFSGGFDAPALPEAVLPVDVALAPSGGELVVAVAGHAFTQKMPQIIRVPRGAIGPCFSSFFTGGSPSVQGQVTSVAYMPTGELLVQTREPATLTFVDTAEVIPLNAASHADTGHAVFHANAGGGVACASCHAEGGDDGLTWDFVGIGPRRTQALRGGALGVGPFHWNGDEHDLPTLMRDVFMGRMSGPTLDAGQMSALGRWLDAVPPLAASPPRDASAVARGKLIYNDARNVGCVSCHGGADLTTHEVVDVGTGGRFKVPSLVSVAWRAPFLHDGRAPTLFERFGPSGGGDEHGFTSLLSPSQIADLVAYLETL